MYSNLLKDNPSGNILRMHMLFISLGLGLCMPFIATASEIAVNMRLSFNESQTFEQGIDRLLAFDTATTNIRFLNDRLGTLSTGNIAFTLNGLHSISLNDPGVETFPESPRDLLRVNANAIASGGLLSTPVELDIGAGWRCTNLVLKCSPNEVFSNTKTISTSIAYPANPTDLLQPIRLQATASSTPLAEGLTLNSGQLYLSGSLQVNATFTAKTTTQYVEDALAATSSSAANQRWAAATDDIKAIRSLTLTDLTVDRSLRISNNIELERAHHALSVANDSARLLDIGATTGSTYESSSELMRQLWDMSAVLNPSLARSRASYGSEVFFNSDRGTEVAILQMMLFNNPDDTGFINGLDNAINHPLSNSASPVFSFDGARLGLNGATMSVYFLGSESGDVTLELGAASLYALWHTGDFSNIEYIEGVSESITAYNSLTSTDISLGSEPEYVSETAAPDNLMFVTGNGAALTLGLNNFYTNKALVVATWAVTPVPEPSQAWLFVMGLPLLFWRRRAH